MASDRLRCLSYAKALEKAFRPETVHKLRTHLRRLQSYAEYLDRPKAAERLGEAVSWFSRLRTLDEFQRYLRRLEVGAKDCRRAEKALRNEQKDVRKTNRPAAVTPLQGSCGRENILRSAFSDCSPRIGPCWTAGCKGCPPNPQGRSSIGCAC